MFGLWFLMIVFVVFGSMKLLVFRNKMRLLVVDLDVIERVLFWFWFFFSSISVV